MVDVVTDYRTWSLIPTVVPRLWSSDDTPLSKDLRRLSMLKEKGQELTDGEMSEGRELSRRLLDRMVDNPGDAMLSTLGEEFMEAIKPVMIPIQDERDILLAHNCWHASCSMPPGTTGVAVLGAAHLMGVQR